MTAPQDVVDHVPAKKPWYKTAGWIATLVTALVLSAGTGAYLGLRQPGTFVLDGSITLGENYGGDPCVGMGGYSDIHAGSQVTVTDSTGAVVAIGGLSPGLTTDRGCRLAISVPGVPRGKDFYGVAVGNQARGVQRYAEADIIKDGVDLSLGG